MSNPDAKTLTLPATAEPPAASATPATPAATASQKPAPSATSPGAASGPPKLHVDDLHVVYRGRSGDDIEAVRGVSFDIHDKPGIGELVVFLGPSGCGKSTILKAVAGLFPPTRGQILIEGQPVSGPGRDRGMVFQQYTSFSWLTVEQNVEYGLRLRGVPEKERREQAADPASLDALDGLGAIALRDGRPAEAEAYFRRALLARPNDPVALAGLSRLQVVDPQRNETRLRNSLASQPDAPAPHVALAETLARQQRWAEAQQAWFQAHRLTPDEPDIAYNLAVSLDHLGQRRPAASYYRKALHLADRQPARFSREHCETRLQTLQTPEPAP